MQEKPFPFEFAMKVDPYNSNERYLARGHDDVPAIQIKFSDTRWLLDHCVENLLSPEQYLIVSGWEDGDKLLGRTPDTVFDRYMELEEYIDYAFALDRWTYNVMSRRANRDQIDRSVESQLILYRRLQEINADIEFYPTILGWKRWHLERNRPLVDEISSFVGFDATGYRSKYELAKDVNRTIDVLDVELYLSGRIGPTHLAYMPTEVQAFSGKGQFFKEVRQSNGGYSRDLLSESIAKRIRAFDSSQTELRQFTLEVTGD